MTNILQQRLLEHRLSPSDRKIKLYIDDLEHSQFFPAAAAHMLPFDLESDHFEITTDIVQSDFIPYNSCDSLPPCEEFLELYKKVPGKPVLLFHITHIYEEKKAYYDQIHRTWKEFGIDNVHLIITDLYAKHNHPFAHNYDFLWNRQKAYFYDYDRFVRDSALAGEKNISRIWSRHASKAMYELPDIVKFDTNNIDIYKKFLSPNRVTPDYKHTRRGLYRTLFSDYIANQSDTYASDWMKNTVLDPQEQGFSVDANDYFAGWWPVANRYYSSSIISVYVETLVTHTDIRTITEKTFDPLIKGHFILPFGYCGLVSDIKEHYGFCFPEWIDYGYDAEKDEVKRFYLFTRELLRLRNNFTIKQLAELRNRDDYMLHRNRQIFLERPYNSLYQIVADTVYDKTQPKKSST